jgi:Gp37 protein
MNYEALETELVGVLNAYFADNGTDGLFMARVLPDNQVDARQDYAKAVVNVLYYDGDYGEPLSTGAMVQEETVRVLLVFQANHLRGDGGFYAFIAGAKNALTGYRPAGARTRMWISDYSSASINDGQLMPALEFSFRTEVLQVRFEDEGESGIFEGAELV